MTASTREIVQKVLDNTQVDSLITKAHVEKLTEELVEALGGDE